MGGPDGDRYLTGFTGEGGCDPLLIRPAETELRSLLRSSPGGLLAPATKPLRPLPCQVGDHYRQSVMRASTLSSSVGLRLRDEPDDAPTGRGSSTLVALSVACSTPSRVVRAAGVCASARGPPGG